MWSEGNCLKMENQLLFCLHDNVPAHRSILVAGFLAKNKLTTLEHPPYSPDQSPAGFYLLPLTKSELKGWRFYDAHYIIKNATKELKRLS
jgi:transposase